LSQLLLRLCVIGVVHDNGQANLFCGPSAAKNPMIIRVTLLMGYSCFHSTLVRYFLEINFRRIVIQNYLFQYIGSTDFFNDMHAHASSA
jgi:hypothetical protein